MINWRSIPFVMITLSFMTGTLVCLTWGDNWSLMLTLGVVLLVVYLWYHWRSGLQWWTTILGLIVIICLGYVNGDINDQSKSERHFNNWDPDSIVLAEASISEFGWTKNGQIKLIVNMYRLLDINHHYQPVQGNLIVYLRNEEELNLTFNYGQRVAFHLTDHQWQSISPPANPHAFDYSAHMAKQQVYHQLFLSQKDVHLLDGFRGSQLKKLAFFIREQCKDWLKAYIDDQSRRSVAAALLVGEKSWLPSDVKTIYRDTGATHVLAVSGLHTGIIAGSILWLMQFIGKRHWWQRVLKCIAALACLWLFVLITGMAPSVLRAATMFSFILVAKILIKRDVNLYNVIALSAFILVWLDPFIILQIGFQLSYAALLGIIAFQDKIYRSIYMPYRWLRVIWQLMTVSLAAQLGTLPFTIYYFNMLPLYAWLSGIIVVPLAGLILQVGMLLFISAWIIPSVAIVPAYLLNVLIFIMNSGVDLCHQLPVGVISGLWLKSSDVILMALAVVCFGLAISTYQKFLLKVGLIFLMAFTICYSVRQLQLAHQEVLTIYHLKGFTLIDFFDGYTCRCLTDADTSDTAFKYAVENNRMAHGIKHCSIKSVDDDSYKLDSYTEGQVYWFNNELSIYMDDQVGYIINKSFASPDVQVLTDGGFDYYSAAEAERYAAKAEWDYYNTFRKGALKWEK